MITYLIKTIACSAVFLLVYLLFLEREKMHRFNRWYLLGTVVLSFIIPLVSIPVSAEVLPVLSDTYIINWEPGGVVATPSASAIAVRTTTQPATGFRIPVWALVYGSVTLFLFIRFTRNIYLLVKAVLTREIVRYNGVSLVVVKGDISSYTFFNTIFISETDYPADDSRSPVLIHELAHVRQKHSWDVLFIELVKVFCWFNPIFILYKKAMQLNHEFLADTAVMNGQTDIRVYQHLLLDKLSQGTPLALASSFNYSITKKRLLMMTQHQNHRRTLLKQLAGVATGMLCLLLFSSKTVLSNNPANSISQLSLVPADTTVKKTDTGASRISVPPAVLKDVPYTAAGLTTGELQEYREAEKKYFPTRLTKTAPYVREQMGDDQRFRLEILFKKMNREQQMQSHIVFWPPLKPFKKEIPTEEQMQKWTTNKDYGVWVDSKRISNEALSKYKASDFSYYSASKLSKNAVNYPYHKVQLDLMTNEAFIANNKRLAGEKHFMMVFSYGVQRSTPR